MSRYIAKYMNLEKSKRPIFWNGGSTILLLRTTVSLLPIQFRRLMDRVWTRPFTSLSRSRRLHGSIVHGCLLRLSTSFTLGQWLIGADRSIDYSEREQQLQECGWMQASLANLATCNIQATSQIYIHIFFLIRSISLSCKYIWTIV